MTLSATDAQINLALDVDIQRKLEFAERMLCGQYRRILENSAVHQFNSLRNGILTEKSTTTATSDKSITTHMPRVQLGRGFWCLGTE